MKRLGILSLWGLSFAAALCTTASADIVQTRQKNQTAAEPLIEAALTRPMSELYAATYDRSPKAGLILGLALLADRRRSNTAQDLSDLDALITLEARVHAAGQAWLGHHPGKVSEDIDWDKVVELTPGDRRLLDHIQETYSANFWLSLDIEALPETDSPQNCTNCSAGTWRYKPGYLAGGGAPYNAASGQNYGPGVINWTGVGLSQDVAMTAVHCIESVREQADGPADAFLFYRLDVGQLQPVAQYSTVPRLVYELKTVDAKRPYFTGRAACGSQFEHYVALRKAEPFEPSALRTRFGIGQ